MADTHTRDGAPQPTVTFSTELAEVIEPVRRAFRRLLADWGSPATAAEFDRESGAGATICWQVFRVAHAPDPVAEARQVPTPTSLKRLLTSAAAAGIVPATLDAVETAARNFERFGKRVAPDRSSFSSMLAGVASDQPVEKIPVSLRRAAYRAMSSINGLQSDLMAFTALVRAGATPDVCDQVTVQVNGGIRRLRPDVPLVLHHTVHNPSGMPGGIHGDDALDQGAAREHGMPILPDFSMNPLPEVEQIEEPPGYTTCRVRSREVGLQASVDCTFAHYNRNTPLQRDTDGRLLYHMTFRFIRRPIALSVMDLLVHRPSFPGVRPQHMIHFYSDADGSQAAARAAQQYPVDVKLTKIGRADVATLRDVPRYGEVLQNVVERVGWDLSEFDVYRLRVPYPIVFSAQRIYFYIS